MLVLFVFVFSPLIILLIFGTQISILEIMSSGTLRLLFLLTVVLNAIIGVRILKFKTAAADHRTYTYFLFLFSLLMFLIGIIRELY